MSANYDMKHNVKVVPVFAPAVLDADTTPTAIDLSGYGSATILTHVGAGGITFTTSNKVEFTLTHSDDNATYEAVAADDVLMPYGESWAAGGIIRSLIAAKASADTEVHAVGYRGKKRYLKYLANFGGTHGSGTPMAASVILGNPRNRPVGQTSFES